MATLVTEVEPAFWGRSIEEPRLSSSARIVLDVAEPWGGGRIEGRVESSKPQPKGFYVVSVACSGAWLDIAPPADGSASTGRAVMSNFLMHGIGIKIWLDELLWSTEAELGELSDRNWLPFAFDLPSELPRAFEGNRVSFRWRITARRRRAVVRAQTSLPLLLREDRTIPTARVETGPSGTWRFRAVRSEAERDIEIGRFALRFEDRPSDALG